MLCKALRFARVDLPETIQVALVPKQYNLDVLVRVLPNLMQPLGHVVEGNCVQAYERGCSFPYLWPTKLSFALAATEPGLSR